MDTGTTMASIPLDVIVVGGGLAGLTAAVNAARDGASVVLLEARSTLGGRGRTKDQAGFLFNEGAHALYDGGVGVKVLNELGITPRGNRPPLKGWGFYHGAIKRIPATPIEAMRTRLVGMRAKTELGMKMLNPAKLLDTGLVGRSASEWIAENFRTDDARALVSITAMIGTYCGDLDDLAAEAAVTQVVGALEHGVLYLDGGWQQIVDRLRDAAVAAGVTIHSGARVMNVRVDREQIEVATSTGTFMASAVVLAAGGPTHAATLLGDTSAEVTRWAATERPCHVASLDLGLRRLPDDRHRFVMGLDQPLYLSAHTPTAALAPNGGEVVHVMWYGDPGHDPRPELEALLDMAQPGWRIEVVAEQYGRMRVATQGRPTPGGGFAGRPSVAVPDVERVLVAGDWVGPVGMLGEASLASGRSAGQAAVRAARKSEVGV
ncbi:MAG TPA: NAD(P)/FAD-dependent oxidoreductase [Microthrixaceae bacterium]|nr:NAD(P)/FAD-dependent oxidoreductase [Microthrixaceae bacterium]